MKILNWQHGPFLIEKVNEQSRGGWRSEKKLRLSQGTGKTCRVGFQNCCGPETASASYFPHFATRVCVVDILCWSPIECYMGTERETSNFFSFQVKRTHIQGMISKDPCPPLMCLRWQGPGLQVFVATRGDFGNTGGGTRVFFKWEGM